MRQKSANRSSAKVCGRPARCGRTAFLQSDPYETLTERELTVLRLTAEGKSSRIIGSLLSISPRTVETHRENLMTKLRLQGRAELIRYALLSGILPPSL